MSLPLSAFSKNLILAITVSIGSFLIAPSVPAVEVRPDGDYCREINDPSAGFEIVLSVGEYRGRCRIRRGGKPGSPLVIHSIDSRITPEIRYDGETGSVFEIDANYVTVRGLRIGPTEGEVDGIRILSGNYVTIEGCVFDQIGGIAIVANHASIRGTVVRRNIINDSRSTAMYFGCHDGTFCTASELLLEANYINGVSARGAQIGYGIQLKLNSTGIIRDNVIVNTKGPGIMVYGSRNASEASTIERNYVEGSRESSGIVVGGGPAVVRNNIAAWNNDGGIGLEDYGNRGLLRKVAVTYNTIYKNGRGGIVGNFGRSTDGLVFGNAIVCRPETSAIFSERGGFVIFGNEDCSARICFVNPEERDFTPTKALGLVFHPEFGRTPPIDDYFRKSRGSLPVVGAIEPPGGNVILGVKSLPIQK